MNGTKGLAGALIEARADLRGLTKGGRGQYGNYIELDDVLAVVVPALTKAGVVVMQHPTINERGFPCLRTVFIHAESGEREEDTMPLYLPKEDPQGQGSAITYARRYALVSALGLSVDKDDDGQRATDKVSKAARGEMPTPTPPGKAADSTPPPAPPARTPPLPRTKPTATQAKKLQKMLDSFTPTIHEDDGTTATDEDIRLMDAQAAISDISDAVYRRIIEDVAGVKVRKAVPRHLVPQVILEIEGSVA